VELIVISSKAAQEEETKIKIVLVAWATIKKFW
jgi:hypothetical protein